MIKTNGTDLYYAFDDLNDVWLDAAQYPGKTAKPQKKFIKALLIAAAVALLLSVSSVAVFRVEKADIGGTLSEFFADRITVLFSKDGSRAPGENSDGLLSDLLKENGISGTVLPEMMRAEEFSLLDIAYEKTESIISANIRFTTKENGGTAVITRYTDGVVPEMQYHNARRYREIRVGGVAVFVFLTDGSPLITYSVNDTVYEIYPGCTAEEAAGIAASIR